MTVISGNAQTGQIGSALSQLLTVKIVDAGGIPVTGATVTFAARTGGGAITPPTVECGRLGYGDVDARYNRWRADRGRDAFERLRQ